MIEWVIPPLWWFQVIAIAVIATVTGLAWWRRRKLLKRLRAEWGQVAAPTVLDLDGVSQMWEVLDSRNPEPGALDERTWDDLELDRVVAGLDRTESGLGRQQFYRRLHAGLAWLDTPDLERLTNRFASSPALREEVGVVLARAGRTIGYGMWWITRPDAIRLRSWYAIFPFLTLAMILALITIPFWPPALFVAGLLLIMNVGVRTATAWQVPTLIGPLRQIATVTWAARRLVRTLEGEGIDSATPRADLHALKPLSRIVRWVTRDASAGQAMTAVTETLNLMFLIDANALLFGAKWLRKDGPTLGRVGAWVGDVDLARAVASLRAEPRAWTIPSASAADTSGGTDLWHPSVPDAVLNDVELVQGRGMVITGSNMSGKSTYLRTVGIAAVLARVINTCPASSWNAPPIAVRSLIGRSDDLEAGKSYYQVEADGVVELMAVATQELPTLFLLDELLRGTNTVERLAAGEAVLRALLAPEGDSRPHTVIVATHDSELVGMLNDCYTPWHFREHVGPSGLTFDYKRLSGPATTRTAIALLEASGAPHAVVHQARARADELDAARSRSPTPPPAEPPSA